MQTVNNNLQSCNRYNQSFTGLRKVKCLGLYEKYPELGKELVDTFKNNSKVMDFCKKYDVDIIFHAAKNYMNSVQASVNVFYDNITKNKLKKLFSNRDDQIVISGWGNKYDIPGSIKEATASLKAAMSPANAKSYFPTGLLDAHIELADKKIQKVLDQKKITRQNKSAQKIHKKQSKISEVDAKTKLNNSIKDLIRNSY